ncbi:hypothetical protein GGR56DRAFT_676815 [Xylariaceae sp. FL0804]|nr:hypothetical protein GGR56DRAFT_676815 [Xylariaceae sp. FL0804]
MLSSTAPPPATPIAGSAPSSSSSSAAAAAAAVVMPPPSPRRPVPGMSLHVTVHVAPADVERFLDAFKAVFDLVVDEPECLFFEVYRSPDEPGRISWVENWSKSTQWFLENQMTKGYYAAYLAATEPMFVKPREFRILDRAGPDFFMVKDKPFPPEQDGPAAPRQG